MLSLTSESDLKEAWRLIGRHAGRPQLVTRIASACPSVRLLGNGPFGWLELKRLVEDFGMRAERWDRNPRSGGSILVGDYGWTESELIEAVLSYRGNRLRITCQQDLVYELLLVVEPSLVCQTHAEELARIRAVHPALRWIGTRFGWDRVCNAPVPADLEAPLTPRPAEGAIGRTGGWVQLPQSSDAVMPREGVLQASGYSVGRGGPSFRARRRALRTVMEEVLPPGFHPEYAAQWCGPLTTGRLRKTAETLAALARNAKRRRASMELAIEHWESDLEWLRSEYRSLADRIVWPSSAVD